MESLFIPKNDRDGKAGFLTPLFHVLENDIRIEGKPFTWTRFVHISGGEPFFNEDHGHVYEKLTSDFNEKYIAI